MARLTAETLRRANEILRLAFDSGTFSAALRERSISRVLAEAKAVLGPEFADVRVVVLTTEPYVKAVRP